MGLRTLTVVSCLLLSSCAAKSVNSNAKDTNHQYIACCDPSLNADGKEMCRWLHDNDKTTLQDWYGNVYEGVWQDCKPGEEPWRKWE